VRLLAAIACAAVLTACTPGSAAPPRIDAYRLAQGALQYRLSADVNGSVDIGGPTDSAAITRIIPNGNLGVKARMRLDYRQEVAPSDPSGAFELHLVATDLQGRIESFLSTRTLGAPDLGAVGRNGVISVAIAANGAVVSAAGSPLGRFDLPVLRDVLTLWPCPVLPPGGVAPGDRWESQVAVGDGTQLITSHDEYTPVDKEGTHLLDLSAEREGNIAAGDIDLDRVLAILSGDDGAATHIGTASVTATVHLRSSCRLSEAADSLDSWETDGKVDVTLSAQSGGRFDGVLDGTTMSFDVSASARIVAN